MGKITKYSFDVECVEAGQRRKYGDSFYSFKVTSTMIEKDVKTFCMGILNPSYEPKDMPNPFAGRLLEFKKLTDNNKDRNFLDDTLPEEYSYKIKCEYTG